MRALFEQFLEAERFNMNSLYDALKEPFEREQTLGPLIRTTHEIFGQNFLKKFCLSIIRNVFLIELVKRPAIETTKFRVRWFEELENDPRWCSFEECLSIAQDIFREVNGLDRNSSEVGALKLSFDFGLIPYEMPIDYLAVEGETRIHRRENIKLIFSDSIQKTLQLRKFLLEESTSPDVVFFKKVLDEKVKIKTYLTDRALTGYHKTNREKRWETHPNSVQYATRKSCIEIEYTLIKQLCFFEAFPTTSKQILQQHGLLPGDMQTFKCPITQNPMIFSEFKEELENPSHGKSNFQVGHLNPLKLEAQGERLYGHNANNISWVSADGNRIQGSMSLNEIRTLLRRIAANYDAIGWNL